MTNVTFEEIEIDRFTATQPFDAAVGRFVLMYQFDPVVTLATISRTVRNGGLMVVQEPDFRAGVSTFPTVALWHQVRTGLRKRFAAAVCTTKSAASFITSFAGETVGTRARSPRFSRRRGRDPAVLRK